MQRPTIERLLLAIALLSLLCGCGPSATPTPRQEDSRQIQIVRQLPVAGPWGAPSPEGIRARVLVNETEAMETGSVLVSIALHNITNRPATMRLEGSPALTGHHVVWRVGEIPGQTARPVVADPQLSTSLRLAPGETHVTDPVHLGIPPGEGTQSISGSLTLGQAVIAVPGVGLQVTPAPWGPIINGVRMRFSASSETYPVGVPPALTVYIQNVEHEMLRLRTPDWSTFDIGARRDRLTFNCTTSAEQFVELPKGQFWSAALKNVPLAVPGVYRVSFALDSPEYPAANGVAWNGRINSNEIQFEILGN